MFKKASSLLLVLILAFTSSIVFAGTSICHIPPGHSENAKTIVVGSQNSVDAHLAHGDSLGECGSHNTPTEPPTATGEGTWFGGGALHSAGYALFHAQGEQGNQPARGHLTWTSHFTDGSFRSSFEANINYLSVGTNAEGYPFACFSGVAYNVAGNAARDGRDGQTRWTMVIDRGEGANSEGDFFRGDWAVNMPNWCANGVPNTNTNLTSGDIQVHFGIE